MLNNLPKVMSKWSQDLNPCVLVLILFYSFEKWLILGLEQEICKMSLENLGVTESLQNPNTQTHTHTLVHTHAHTQVRLSEMNSRDTGVN